MEQLPQSTCSQEKVVSILQKIIGISVQYVQYNKYKYLLLGRQVAIALIRLYAGMIDRMRLILIYEMK